MNIYRLLLLGLLHKEVPHDFFSSPNIITGSHKMGYKWAKRVTDIGRRDMYTVFWGNLQRPL
jgi:hypothetical protein